MSACRKPGVDWAAIERDHRAGVLSLREMAKLHGINHVSIKARADKEGWTRDLAAKIQAKADAIVNRDVANRTANTVADLTSERETVDAVGGAVANVKLKHRSHATRLGAVNESLLAELEFVNANAGQLVEWAKLIRSPDEFGSDRQNDLLMKMTNEYAYVVQCFDILLTQCFVHHFVKETVSCVPLDSFVSFVATFKFVDLRKYGRFVTIISSTMFH